MNACTKIVTLLVALSLCATSITTAAAASPSATVFRLRSIDDAVPEDASAGPAETPAEQLAPEKPAASESQPSDPIVIVETVNQIADSKPSTVEVPASVPSTSQVSEASAEAPVLVELPLEPFQPPVLPELPPLPLQRRVVSYDQRQEGKYNIRADLENFMIVVIPSSPSSSSGASLLDLLTLRHTNQQHQKSTAQKAAASVIAHQYGAKKDKVKKYQSPPVGAKTASSWQTKADNVKQLQEAVAAELARRSALANAQQQQQPQAFIEGRTPYHVDISSSAQQAPQLPTMPLVERLLMRRASKALNEATDAGILAPLDLGHNSVVLLGHLNAPSSSYYPHRPRGFAFANMFVKSADRYDSLLLRGSDDEDVDDGDNETSYADEFSGGAATADSVDRLAAGETPKSGTAADNGWDQLTLLGADEQCGPDRRRDSYGVCQFVPTA